MYKWMVDGWVEGWMDGCMNDDRYMNGWMQARTSGYRDGWVDG